MDARLRGCPTRSWKRCIRCSPHTVLSASCAAKSEAQIASGTTYGGFHVQTRVKIAIASAKLCCSTRFTNPCIRLLSTLLASNVCSCLKVRPHWRDALSESGTYKVNQVD